MTAIRSQWVLPALLALLVGALGLAHLSHGPTLGVDDHGQYLLHARALVEGRPYTDIGFIHTRYSTLVAPIAEPPGVPALAAGVFRLVGESWAGARAILYVAFALIALVVFVYWKRAAGATTAAIVTAWTLTAIARLHGLDSMLADLPFIATLWFVFTLADGEPIRGARLLILLALAGAAAFAFRMAALPLLPAAATAVLLRSRDARGPFLVAGVTWTLAAIAVMWGLPAAEVLGSETLRSPTVMLHDAALNARAVWEGARGWIPVTIPARLPNLALHSAMLGLAAVGAAVALARAPRRFAYLTAAWYLLMLALLPTRASRYMWPLYPFMCFAFMTGVEWVIGLARKLPTPRRHLPGFVAAACVVIIGVAQDATAPEPPTFRAVPEIRQVLDVLAREDRPGRRPRVVFFSPRVLSWETRLTTMAMFDAPPDEALRLLRESGITHVVSGDAGTYTLFAPAIPTLIASRPTWFEEIHRNGQFGVYRFSVPPGS